MMTFEEDALKRFLELFPGRLTEREQQIIKMRCGLLDGRKQTLQEIGNTFGVCRERIRQIVNKVRRRLKHPSYAKLLPPWVAEIKKEKTNV